MLDLPALGRVFVWPEILGILRYVSTRLDDRDENGIMRQSGLFQPPLTQAESLIYQDGVRTSDGWGPIVVVNCWFSRAMARASPRAYIVKSLHMVKMFGTDLDTRRCTYGQKVCLIVASRKEQGHQRVVRDFEEACLISRRGRRLHSVGESLLHPCRMG